jgi:glycosyltransferase 2 family protein
MKSNLRKKLLLSLGFGALVFIVMTVIGDADKLATAFAQFNWSFAPLILVCSTANYFLRYLKWDYYTRVLDIRPSTKQNIIIFFAAFTMAVTPGKLGEVLKSYLLKSLNGTPIARSAPVVLAERLTDFISLMLLIFAGAWVFGYARGVIALLAVFFACVTALLAWRRGSMWCIDRLGRLPLIKRFAHHATDAYESVYALLRPRILLNAVVLSAAAWGCECLGFWIILRDFHTPPSLLKATFIYSFSTIVGAVSMLPGGLGTTEGSLTALSIIAGVPKTIAIASTFIIRVATLWYAVILGVIVTFAFQHHLNVRIDSMPLDAATADE